MSEEVLTVIWRDKVNTGPLPKEWVDYGHPYRKALKDFRRCAVCGSPCLTWNTARAQALHPGCEAAL